MSFVPLRYNKTRVRKNKSNNPGIPCLPGAFDGKDDRVATDDELIILHRIPPGEEDHFVIGRLCRCRPSLEIVDENTAVIDHKQLSVCETNPRV